MSIFQCPENRNNGVLSMSKVLNRRETVQMQHSSRPVSSMRHKGHLSKRKRARRPEVGTPDFQPHHCSTPIHEVFDDALNTVVCDPEGSRLLQGACEPEQSMLLQDACDPEHSTLLQGVNDENMAEHNDAGDQFLKDAVKKLLDAKLVQSLAKKLNAEGVLDDFVTLCEELACGKLPVNNIAVLLCLERAKLNRCTNSTLMRYSSKTKQFWLVCKLLLRGKGLRLFSGKKNKGQVVSGDTQKGYYLPTEGNLNFAVPDEKTLLCIDDTVPTSIPPGVNMHTMNLLDKTKEYVLAIDSKMMASGLGPNNIGDVNCMGFEEPRLKEQTEMLKLHLTDIDNFRENFEDLEPADHIVSLQIMLSVTARQMQRIREARCYYERKLKENEAKIRRNPILQGKYSVQLSSCKAFLVTTGHWLKTALYVNDEMARLMAVVNGNSMNASDDDIMNLMQQQNVRQLKDVDVVKKTTNINEHPEVVKQRTEDWHKLRKLSLITGSTAYSALGLRTAKEQNQHYKIMVEHQDPAEPSPDVQERMNHGLENEIQGIGNFASKFMPAFLSPCAVLYEDGANFIHGTDKQNLFEVSTDGYVAMCKHDHNIVPFSFSHEPCIVEVKCPTPNGYTVTQHYSIPVYYGIQMLSEMKCKEVEYGIYVCYTAESVVYVRLTFNQTIWDEIWQMVEEMYGVVDIDMQKPRMDVEKKKEMKNKIQTYLDTHSTLLAEIPPTQVMDIPHDDEQLIGCHIQPYPITHAKSPPRDLSTKVDVICGMVKDVLAEGTELLRRKANNIMAFVVSDKDRAHTPNVPAHMPVAYALHDSLKNKNTVVRKMVNEVRNQLLVNKVSVACESYDGEWADLVFRSSDGSARTPWLLQKDAWKPFAKPYTLKYVLGKVASLTGLQSSEASVMMQTQHRRFTDVKNNEGEMVCVAEKDNIHIADGRINVDCGKLVDENGCAQWSCYIHSDRWAGDKNVLGMAVLPKGSRWPPHKDGVRSVLKTMKVNRDLLRSNANPKYLCTLDMKLPGRAPPEHNTDDYQPVPFGDVETVEEEEEEDDESCGGYDEHQCDSADDELDSSGDESEEDEEAATASYDDAHLMDVDDVQKESPRQASGSDGALNSESDDGAMNVDDTQCLDVEMSPEPHVSSARKFDHIYPESHTEKSKREEDKKRQTENKTKEQTSPELQCMLHALQWDKKSNRREVWKSRNTTFLWNKCLRTASTIHETLLAYELQVMAKALKKLTKKSVFSAHDKWKCHKVNRFSELFGDGSKVYRQQQKEVKYSEGFHKKDKDTNKVVSSRYVALSLKDIAFQVCENVYEKKADELAVFVATCNHLELLENWNANMTVDPQIRIPGVKEPYTMYSYPEFSGERQQIEPRCLDPTHILTNLRSKVTSAEGVDFINKEHFEAVADKSAVALPMLIVSDLVDKQNAGLALQVFSKEVEDVMKKECKFPQQAAFVKLVREWYMACDSSEIAVNERLEMLHRMHVFLTDGVDFESFPAPSMYIKGLPPVTYEGILQNIAIRIALYGIVANNTYNPRAISTLSIESLFSDIGALASSGNGIPHAKEIGNIIAHVTRLNYHKHDPTKVFKMDILRKEGYPVQFTHDVDMDATCAYSDVEEEEEERSAVEMIKYKASFFDLEQKRSKAKRRRFMKPLKMSDVEVGARPIREMFHKRKSHREPATKAMGLPDEPLSK